MRSDKEMAKENSKSHTKVVADSLNTSREYLQPHPSFLHHNYDPYIKPIVEDVEPEEAMRPPPSFWRRLVHSLSH